jgi:hypothetical protein
VSPRTPAAAAASLALAVLTGCGTTTKIDGAKSETLVTKVVEQQVGAQVRSVTCPRDLVAKAGETFQCAVTGVDGSSGRVTVTERDDRGALAISAPFLPVRRVASSIGERLTERFGARTTLRCPEIVVLAEGERFHCRARSGGERRRIRVTQEDGRGRVRYAVVG